MPADDRPLSDSSIVISVTGIELLGFHGATAREQRSGCRLTVDIEGHARVDRALHSDEIADTIDYRRIERTVLDVNRRSRFTLIESFANALAVELLTAHEALDDVTVSVSKREPVGMGAGVVPRVSLTLRRS
jgi:dihydroneopterin aldolase